MVQRTAASPRRRWFAGWRTAPRSSRDDPADQGTAFGMEMSLLPDSGDAPAPPRARWWQRRPVDGRSQR